jgi:hypothetical protein
MDQEGSLPPRGGSALATGRGRARSRDGGAGGRAGGAGPRRQPGLASSPPGRGRSAGASDYFSGLSALDTSGPLPRGGRGANRPDGPTTVPQQRADPRVVASLDRPHGWSAVSTGGPGESDTLVDNDEDERDGEDARYMDSLEGQAATRQVSRTEQPSEARPVARAFAFSAPGPTPWGRWT